LFTVEIIIKIILQSIEHEKHASTTIISRPLKGPCVGDVMYTSTCYHLGTSRIFFYTKLRRGTLVYLPISGQQTMKSNMGQWFSIVLIKQPLYILLYLICMFLFYQYKKYFFVRFQLETIISGLLIRNNQLCVMPTLCSGQFNSRVVTLPRTAN